MEINESNDRLAEELDNLFHWGTEQLKSDIVDMINHQRPVFQQLMEYKEIVKEACVALGCDKDSFLDRIKGMSVKLYKAQSLLDKLEKKRNLLPLMQKLRDRFIQNKDQQGVDIIDSYIISGKL